LLLDICATACRLPLATCHVPLATRYSLFSCYPSYSSYSRRVILGVAAFLGWMHFMQDSFKFSQTLGPLVLMVTRMLMDRWPTS
jgi:hypothetical protein